MTKTTRMFVLAAAAMLTMNVNAALSAGLEGNWARPTGSSKIRIAPCGSSLCGNLIWLRDPRKDTKNPDPAKRARPLLGVRIVLGMKPTGKANQWKGKVYNAEDGKTYTGFIKLTASNKMHLEGCVMGGLLCKGETWTRVK